ncbi:arsenite efflux transporter metallochaperone ArsD [Aquisphaera insulae]|uniref:arsenite efflux transporter metallochaperone ArsD n=1 Tax=Aquisphaera insulae TaxID=2712864 RepID=UPI0013EC3A57|nr:arsenite efflux transporter metallochaperone ArsD [Aquisphaera insulae]
MTRLALYDPPMCCSTGVCGPAIDPALPRIAADLDWLKRQGVQVERYNLAQQPQAFASNPTVTAALREHGNDCLPLVLVDGEVASRGAYPDRAELARLSGLAVAAEAEAEAAGPKGAASCCTPGVVAIGGAGRSSGKCC